MYLEVLIMFVKLKENITHEEFIIYTFGLGLGYTAHNINISI